MISKKFWQQLFGERLKEERYRYCMTLQELADNLGVSAMRLKEFEEGSLCPSAYTIYKLTKIFPSVDFLNHG